MQTSSKNSYRWRHWEIFSDLPLKATFDVERVENTGIQRLLKWEGGGGCQTVLWRPAERVSKKRLGISDINLANFSSVEDAQRLSQTFNHHCDFDLHFSDDLRCWASFRVHFGHLHVFCEKNNLSKSSAHWKNCVLCFLSDIELYKLLINFIYYPLISHTICSYFLPLSNLSVF